MFNFSVLSRSSVGGGMGGDVTAVGVVHMRVNRTPTPHYTILGAKVQKIFYICKFICIWGWDFLFAGGTGLGSLRLLSPMYGRYYGEKTRAGKSGEREQADTGGSRKQPRGLDRRERTEGV